MIRSHRYVDNCCRRELVPALPQVNESQSSQSTTIERLSESLRGDEGPMEYGKSRSFKRCTVKSRKLEGGPNQKINSEYVCLQDFPKGGDVEIGKTVEKDAWSTTRWVNVVSHCLIPAEQCHQCMSPIVQPWTYGVRNLMIRATRLLCPGEEARDPSLLQMVRLRPVEAESSWCVLTGACWCLEVLTELIIQIVDKRPVLKRSVPLQSSQFR